MKRTIKTLFLATLLIPSISFAAFDTSLKYGSKGQAVFELQEFLVTQGYLQHEPTGNFYFLTLNAVKQFQLANELPVTGYFGIMSRSRANDIVAQDLNVSFGAAKEELASSTPTTTPEVPIIPAPIILPPTTPPPQIIYQPVYLPPPMPEVKKDLQIEKGFCGFNGVSYCAIYAYYSENGLKIKDIPITLSSDGGTFVENGENTITKLTQAGPPQGIGVPVQFLPDNGKRTITAIANGVTATFIVY